MVFYYYYNAQGDVMGLRNDSGNSVVQYTYDSWGKLLSTTGTMAGFINPYNPFRYRGYFYDEETGLYYLNSRYYDPETGRFLNADGYVSTGQGLLGTNMFAYCGNNPTNNADESGTCFYNVNGYWCHDNWEYIGGYQRTTQPNAIYDSADEAAMAFSEIYYAYSQYSRHEYGAKIFSINIWGKTKYGYTDPVVGSPHSVSYSGTIPKGGTYVSTVHTHPNSEKFSTGDKKNANNRQMNSYLATPNNTLLRYNFADGTTTDLGSFSVKSLTLSQQAYLSSALVVSWDSHFNNGVCPKFKICTPDLFPR